MIWMMNLGNMPCIHILKKMRMLTPHCAAGTYWAQCIPYEGNEHLVGTKTNAEKKFELGQYVKVWGDDPKDFHIHRFLRYNNDSDYPYLTIEPCTDEHFIECAQKKFPYRWKHCEPFTMPENNVIKCTAKWLNS